MKLTKQQLKEIIRAEICNLTEVSKAYKNATKLELQQYLVNLNTELRGETDSKKIKILKRDMDDVKKELQLRSKSKKESITEAKSKTIKYPTSKGILHIEIEEAPAGIFVDVIFNKNEVSTTDIQFPTGETTITHKTKRVKLKESTNEVISGLKRNDNIDGLGRYEYIVGDYTIDMLPMGKGHISLHIIKKGYGGYLFDTPKRFTSEKDAEKFIKSVLPKIKKGEMGKAIGFKK